MSYSVAGTADGLRFFAVGNDARPSEEVVDKIASGLDIARLKLGIAMTRTYALAVGKGTSAQLELLTYCFKPSKNERHATCLFVRDVLTKARAGLMQADLEICEADEAQCKEAKGDGYVPMAALGVLAFMGNIHMRFSLPKDDAPRLLIHEATHKFAATKDVAYGITNNFRRIQQLKGEGLQTASTAGVMSNADGLANAESYAAFAMCVE